MVISLDTQSQKTEFLSNPEKYQRYRKTIEHDLNSRFKSVLRNSAESNEANAVRLPLYSSSCYLQKI